jgi:hypothetical protein
MMRAKARQVVEGALAQPASRNRTAVVQSAGAPAGTLEQTTAPLAAAGLRCLPTCSTTDGRFLAIAGTGFDTLSPPEMDLSIAVPAGSATFDIGIFDGDGGEYGPGGEAFWDAGLTTLFEYSLYADPNADGTGLLPVDLETGSPTILSTDMPDNEWRDFTVSTGSEAVSPSGNFFYVLKVRLANPAVVTLNSFKVRTTAVVSGLTLDPVARPFSYIASWTALNDVSVIYPDFPASATPTTYDGIFRFYFDVPVSQDVLTVWDGDFDRGKYDLTEQDTDDPNTPGSPFLPSWATPDTQPEGVAIGSIGTGSPPDDDNADGFGAYIVRPPSIHYHVTAPDGQFFTNDNPSGNREWEKFTVSTGPFDPLVMDVSTTSLPPGAYYMEVQGVDMLNLNALLLPYRVLCVDDAGAPCAPLRSFLAGDTVYSDTDGSGSQDPGEPGIAGVVVELHDTHGALLGTATTDAGGHYSFAVDKASYEVRVAASNFTTGPLAGLASTTGGDSSTDTVTDDNVLDFDFGYRGTASLAGRVWNDLDGDGMQDSGEAGLNGVGVQLLDSSGSVIATQTTSGNGNYVFTNLTPGTYSVRVMTSTLPAGVTPTFDADGTSTPHIATVTVSASRSDVDFGYRPATVCTAGYFKDDFTSASFSNNNGTLSWTGAWVESDVAGTGVSNGNVTVGTPVSGYMIFRDSPDTGTQPSAARQADLSGFATATLTVNFHIRGVEADDAAVIEVSKNGGTSYTVLETLTGYTGTYISARTFDISSFIASNTRIRFRISGNYGGSDDFFKVDSVKIDAGCSTAPQTGSAGDRVWKDSDGDGVQDSSEAGLNGVTVQLLNSGGTVIATQVTSGNGNYLFSGLAAATYKVKVVSSTLPSGYTQTYDFDGTGTAHTATFTLTAGQNRTDIDFGYRPAPTCTAGYFLDQFSSASFSNNNGTLSWSGAWVEYDVAGTGVSSGNVTVGTPYSGYLILDDNPDTGTQPSAARQANLAGFTSATLKFDFHTRDGVDPDDAAVIEVSNNGGTSYTVLETLTGFTGRVISSRTYNISAYIASNTRIRFRISSNYGGSDELFKVDQVRIDAGCQ